MAKVNGDVRAALAAPDLRSRLTAQSLEPVGNSPEEFGAFVKTEIEKWANLVKVARMKMD